MDIYSQNKRITEHIQDRYGAEPEHLWARTPNYAVFRRLGKWFALIMDIPKSKLGFNSDETVCILNIKCSPLMTGSLLKEDGFFPAYHMNKNTWVSILLDNSVPDGNIFTLIEMSYDSIAPKKNSSK